MEHRVGGHLRNPRSHRCVRVEQRDSEHERQHGARAEGPRERAEVRRQCVGHPQHRWSSPPRQNGDRMVGDPAVMSRDDREVGMQIARDQRSRPIWQNLRDSRTRDREPQKTQNRQRDALHAAQYCASGRDAASFRIVTLSRRHHGTITARVTRDHDPAAGERPLSMRSSAERHDGNHRGARRVADRA